MDNMGKLIKSTSLKVKHLLSRKDKSTNDNKNNHNHIDDEIITRNTVKSRSINHGSNPIPRIITTSSSDNTTNTESITNKHHHREYIPSSRLLSHTNSQNSHTKKDQFGKDQLIINTTSTKNSINPYYESPKGKDDNTIITRSSITAPTACELNQLPLLNINANFADSLHSSQGSLITN